VLNGGVKQRCAAAIHEIGIPVPFDLGEFCARLERHRGRSIRLVAVPARLDAPSGLWVSTADTDYIYHPEGISPLHRAHIVLHEISHMLLGHLGGPRDGGHLADLLAPDLSDGLARLILGRSSYTSAEEHDAEIMASLLLERAARPAARPPFPACRTVPIRGRHSGTPATGVRGPMPGVLSSIQVAAGTARGTWGLAIQALQRWRQQCRSYRQLHPLWSALRLAVPQIALSPPRGMRHHIGFRLYRRVIEIRDGELALRPYRDPNTTQAAASAAADAGLSGDALSTMVQATVLAAALQAKQAGHRAQHPTPSTPVSPGHGPGLDLHSETASLQQVSRAFAAAAAEAD
jgi:hypothetical protein